MAFGFPAYHTERYSTDTSKSADLRVAVRETLTALSWERGQGTISEFNSVEGQVLPLNASAIGPLVCGARNRVQAERTPGTKIGNRSLTRMALT